MDDSENESRTTSQLVDDNNEVEMELDENVCHGCLGAMDGVHVDWMECGECCKWYHVLCANDERLVGMSMEEIEKVNYVCDVCRNKKKC